MSIIIAMVLLVALFVGYIVAPKADVAKRVVAAACVVVVMMETMPVGTHTSMSKFFDFTNTIISNVAPIAETKAQQQLRAAAETLNVPKQQYIPKGNIDIDISIEEKVAQFEAWLNRINYAKLHATDDAKEVLRKENLMASSNNSVHNTGHGSNKSHEEAEAHKSQFSPFHGSIDGDSVIHTEQTWMDARHTTALDDSLVGDLAKYRGCYATIRFASNLLGGKGDEEINARAEKRRAILWQLTHGGIDHTFETTDGVKTNVTLGLLAVSANNQKAEKLTLAPVEVCEFVHAHGGAGAFGFNAYDLPEGSDMLAQWNKLLGWDALTTFSGKRSHWTINTSNTLFLDDEFNARLARVVADLSRCEMKVANDLVKRAWGDGQNFAFGSLGNELGVGMHLFRTLTGKGGVYSMGNITLRDVLCRMLRMAGVTDIEAAIAKINVSDIFGNTWSFGADHDLTNVELIFASSVFKGAKVAKKCGLNLESTVAAINNSMWAGHIYTRANNYHSKELSGQQTQQFIDRLSEDQRIDLMKKYQKVMDKFCSGNYEVFGGRYSRLLTACPEMIDLPHVRDEVFRTMLSWVYDRRTGRVIKESAHSTMVADPIALLSVFFFVKNGLPFVGALPLHSVAAFNDDGHLVSNGSMVSVSRDPNTGDAAVPMVCMMPQVSDELLGCFTNFDAYVGILDMENNELVAGDEFMYCQWDYDTDSIRIVAYGKIVTLAIENRKQMPWGKMLADENPDNPNLTLIDTIEAGPANSQMGPIANGTFKLLAARASKRGFTWNGNKINSKKLWSMIQWAEVMTWALIDASKHGAATMNGTLKLLKSVLAYATNKVDENGEGELRKLPYFKQFDKVGRHAIWALSGEVDAEGNPTKLAQHAKNMIRAGVVVFHEDAELFGIQDDSFKLEILGEKFEGKMEAVSNMDDLRCNGVNWCAVNTPMPTSMPELGNVCRFFTEYIIDNNTSVDWINGLRLNGQTVVSIVENIRDAWYKAGSRQDPFCELDADQIREQSKIRAAEQKELLDDFIDQMVIVKKDNPELFAAIYNVFVCVALGVVSTKYTHGVFTKDVTGMFSMSYNTNVIDPWTGRAIQNYSVFKGGKVISGAVRDNGIDMLVDIFDSEKLDKYMTRVALANHKERKAEALRRMQEMADILREGAVDLRIDELDDEQEDAESGNF